MNVGGWRSDEQLFRWEIQAVLALRDLVREFVGSAGELVGWAIINRNGSFHKRHKHRGRTSGIYYVDPGNGPGARTLFDSVIGELAVEPRAGRLLTFPSVTWHRVERYVGAAPRITIGFDVR